MTNQTNEVEVNETVEAPKRKRTVKPKVTKTAIQITEELKALQAEVEELEISLDEIAPSNVLHELASKVVEEKKAELVKALETVYTV